MEGGGVWVQKSFSRKIGNYFCMLSKEFATTYFMTSITGKRNTQNCKKCDWSVKRDFSIENSVHNTVKGQIR